VHWNAVLAGEEEIDEDTKTRADEEKASDLSQLSQKISSSHG